jgi:hypothetical protein
VDDTLEYARSIAKRLREEEVSHQTPSTLVSHQTPSTLVHIAPSVTPNGTGVMDSESPPEARKKLEFGDSSPKMAQNPPFEKSEVVDAKLPAGPPEALFTPPAQQE